MTVLCTKWGLSKRENYVVIIQLLNEVQEFLKSGKMKYPLAIVMEEVKILHEHLREMRRERSSKQA
jgi:hypothetical protein